MTWLNKQKWIYIILDQKFYRRSWKWGTQTFNSALLRIWAIFEVNKYTIFYSYYLFILNIHVFCLSAIRFEMNASFIFPPSTYTSYLIRRPRSTHRQLHRHISQYHSSWINCFENLSRSEQIEWGGGEIRLIDQR